MAELKTRPQDGNVPDFLDMITDEHKRQDAFTLLGLMQRITGAKPVMWGSSIVGFGQRHYRYASGHEGDTFILGFSPRKEALTLYLPGYLERYGSLLDGLGKYKAGKGCLYVKRLSDVDPAALETLLEAAVRVQL